MSPFDEHHFDQQSLQGDLPALVYASPRKLPKAHRLEGRVVVLDVAFAGKGLGKSFDKSTGKLIRDLGDRLVAWVDHHDNERHADFAHDSRFILSTKAEHAACPEMISPELVSRVGAIETVVTHNDLDGLYSAAKWLLGGYSPYLEADQDARAVDSRIGAAGPTGKMVDRALRARPKDEKLFDTVVYYLLSGCAAGQEEREIEEAASQFEVIEAATRDLAKKYRVKGRVAFVDVGYPLDRFDKTELLLLGQKLASVSIVKQGHNITAAAPFDSGWNLVNLLELGGGMPTRVSVKASRLEELMEKINGQGQNA